MSEEKSFWQQAIDRKLATDIRHGMIFIKGNINKDFDMAHPAEVREYATNGRSTQMVKRLKEEHEKHVKQAMERRIAIGKGKR